MPASGYRHLSIEVHYLLAIHQSVSGRKSQDIVLLGPEPIKGTDAGGRLFVSSSAYAHTANLDSVNIARMIIAMSCVRSLFRHQFVREPKGFHSCVRVVRKLRSVSFQSISTLPRMPRLIMRMPNENGELVQEKLQLK